MANSNGNNHHDYEEIQSAYKIESSLSPPVPVRIAPKAPIIQHNTLGAHSDIDGVPFIMNPNLLTKPANVVSYKNNSFIF